MDVLVILSYSLVILEEAVEVVDMVLIAAGGAASVVTEVVTRVMAETDAGQEALEQVSEKMELAGGYVGMVASGNENIDDYSDSLAQEQRYQDSDFYQSMQKGGEGAITLAGILVGLKGLKGKGKGDKVDSNESGGDKTSEWDNPNAAANADGDFGALNQPVKTPELSTVTKNRLRHNNAVEDANEKFEANGVSTYTEITLKSCTGVNCRADTFIQGKVGQTSTPVPDGYKAYDLNGNELTEIPLGSNGQGRAIIETKTGNATLSGNQSVGYPEVDKGTVIGVGENANRARVSGTIPADTPVVILKPKNTD